MPELAIEQDETQSPESGLLVDHISEVRPTMDQPVHGQRNLGKLLAFHGTSPAYLQRAAIVAVLSFLFFFATLIAFYVRQNLLYFLLAIGFLIVNIITMIGWWLQKRNKVEVFDHGMVYRKKRIRWNEIDSIDHVSDAGLRLVARDGRSIVIPRSVHNIDVLADHIRRELN